MTEEELQAVERRLREIAMESGLGWVIDQADEWIAEGITEEDDSPPRRSYNSWNYRGGLSGGNGYEFDAVRGWSAPRRALKLSDRPVSERVGILIDALHRVLTELPAIEREMVKNFAPSTELRIAPVASVSFAPDQEDRPGFEIRTVPMDSEPDVDTDGADERAQVHSVALLSQLRTLVGPS
jgi:hypothetical protein